MRLVAVLAALGVLLAGCSDDPKPRFEPPPTSPTSPTTTESSEPPDPKPWEVKSKAGAVAFAEHWVDVFNEAQTSGDVSALEPLGTPTCRTCAGVLQRIREVDGAGGFFRGPGWRVLDAEANEIEGATTSVSMNIQRRKQRVREARGEPVTIFEASRAIYRADVEWARGRWVMAELVDFR